MARIVLEIPVVGCAAHDRSSVRVLHIVEEEVIDRVLVENSVDPDLVGVPGSRHIEDL